MLKMTIDNEEVLSNNDISIKEEILSPSSTILNNVYPKTWEQDKDYTSRFYYPKDYSKLNIQNFSVEPEEAGTTIDINGSATLTDVDTTKESRVLALKGQTSQTGTPTPSSPIPVNVVSGDNEINICGKNLWGFLQKNFMANNSTTSTIINVNTLEVTSTNSAYANTRYKVDLPNGTYTFKLGKVTNTNSNMTTKRMTLTQITNGTRSVIQHIDEGNSYTYTIANAENKIYTLEFWASYATALINTATFEEIQIVKGSTAPTTYEPYIGNSYPLYLGVENLFMATSQKGYSYSNGLPASETDTMVIDSFDSNSVSFHNTSSGYRTTLSNTIQLEPSTTYTLSFKRQSTATNNQVFIWNYNSTYSLNTRLNNAADLSTQFTTDSNGQIAIGFGFNNVVGSATISEIQIEKGTKVNHPSSNPIQLCWIPNTTYQDRIFNAVNGDEYYDSLTQAQKDLLTYGKWYLHKEIGKVVLDSTYRQSGGTTGTNAYYIGTTILGLNDNTQALSWSNMFQPCSFNNRANGLDITYLQNGYLQIRTANNTSLDWSDNTKRDNWLNANKPIVYYVLATPTNTEITDTTLLEQLESLSS